MITGKGAPPRHLRGIDDLVTEAAMAVATDQETEGEFDLGGNEALWRGLTAAFRCQKATLAGLVDFLRHAKGWLRRVHNHCDKEKLLLAIEKASQKSDIRQMDQALLDVNVRFPAHMVDEQQAAHFLRAAAFILENVIHHYWSFSSR